MITTDAKFKKWIATVPYLDYKQLWPALMTAAEFFARLGAIEEALSLWRFGYSGALPLSDTYSLYCDFGVSAVCYHCQHSDISEGEPVKTARAFSLPENATLEQRVQAYHAYNWYWMTRDSRTQLALPNVNDASTFLSSLDLYRGALSLAHAKQDKNHANLERALELLGILLDSPYQNAFTRIALGPYDALIACLVASNIALALGKKEEGIRRLRQWQEIALRYPYNTSVQYAFGLEAVSGLICEGVLSDFTQMTTDAKRELAQTLIEEVQRRLQLPDPEKRVAQKYRLVTQQDRFYLEPRQPDSTSPYFTQMQETAQGFSVQERQVGICTPAGTGVCNVAVEFADKLPPVGKAVQSALFPLKVRETDELFLRRVPGEKTHRRFFVKQGDYEVLVRFLATNTSHADAAQNLRGFRAIVTFMPRKIIGA